MKKAVILGVGPEAGLGSQLALRFAPEGMHVLAASRTPSAQETLVAKIRESGGKATGVPTDATNEEQVVSLFENSWRVCCLGGFLFGREALKRMLPKKKGTVIFTGASASLRGRANFGAFNSAKSGLRTLAQAMSKEYGPEGIHVAHVIILSLIHI